VVTHESFPHHSSLLHNPPGSDVAQVGCRPNSLKRQVLETELKNAPQSPGGKSFPNGLDAPHSRGRLADVPSADADAYSSDEPRLFPDLDGKEPISFGIWLTVGNGVFNQLRSAFHRLWSQRQEADEFWSQRIGGDCFDIGGLEGPYCQPISP
jgi:hypothetical protein